MIFLIDYDRRAGRLEAFQAFEDIDLHKAQKKRLELELKLNREGVLREVVLLQAASEGHLHKTHARYFKSLKQLVAAMGGAA